MITERLKFTRAKVRRVVQRQPFRNPVNGPPGTIYPVNACGGSRMMISDLGSVRM